MQIDSEEEKFLEERYAEEMAKKTPQGTDKTPGLLQDIVKGLPDRCVSFNRINKTKEFIPNI